MGIKRRKQPKLLAKKLRAIRVALGLSQVRMAELLDESDPGLISRYEQGKREPSLLTLLQYSRLAGVVMDVLVEDQLELPKRLASKRQKRK